MGSLHELLSPWVVAYLIAVIIIPLVVPLATSAWEQAIRRRRARQGLPESVLVSPGDTSARYRWQVLIETAVTIVFTLLLPLLLIAIARYFLSAEDLSKETERLSQAFVLVLIWIFISGTNLAKAFLGGLAFRSLATFTKVVRVGDRITVGEHHGQVLKIGLFYLDLKTFDEDIVTIPSFSLLESTIKSPNAGERASLCVVKFYFPTFLSREQRQHAEDIIWKCIQSASYFDFSHPVRILYEIGVDHLCLTAKCWVSNTYEEPEFLSDITKRVLNELDQKGIPRGMSLWHGKREQ